MFAFQKKQAEKLELLNPKVPFPEIMKKYVKQRARGAYISFICQLKAAFDYFTAV